MPNKTINVLPYFHNDAYFRHNARRLEHLASLNVPIDGKRILDIGAGIGDHANFYLDRGCSVVSIEARPENVGIMKARRSAESQNVQDRWTIIQARAEDIENMNLGRFHISHVYGLLYHVEDPLKVIEFISNITDEQIFLETAVSGDQQEEGILFGEDSEDPTNSISGNCLTLPRHHFVDMMRRMMGYAYYPKTQPFHPQFPVDWTLIQKVPTDRRSIHQYRFVAIGSRQILDLPTLQEERPTIYGNPIPQNSPLPNLSPIADAPPNSSSETVDRWAPEGPEPTRLKAIIHVGMPKSGSTSIQHALNDAQETLLRQQRIWFRPAHDGAINDAIIFTYLEGKDDISLSAYIETKLALAKENRAETVIFSAERLFVIDYPKEKIGHLISVIRSFDVDVEVVVIVREMRRFLKSYIQQLVYNGSLILTDAHLSTWIALQAQAMAEMHVPVTYVSFDKCAQSKTLVSTFLSCACKKDISLEDYHSNPTPLRSTIYAIAEGVMSKLKAIETGDDVNSPTIDDFRNRIRNTFDDLMNASTHAQAAFDFLEMIGKEIDKALIDYIDRSISLMPEELAKFYAAICEQPTLSLGTPRIEVPPPTESKMDDIVNPKPAPRRRTREKHN